MLRTILIATAVGLPLAAHAETATKSQSLATIIAMLGSVQDQCGQHFAINKAMFKEIMDLAYEDGRRLYGKEYFGEVVARQMAEATKEMNATGAREWCFEARAWLRQRSEDFFPAEAPAR